MNQANTEFDQEVAAAEAAASEKKAKKAKKVKSAEDMEAPAEKKERKPTVRIDKAAVITLKVEANPKRLNSKSYERFNLYVDGQTIGEFLEAGGTGGDVAYDLAKGYIELDRPLGAPKAEAAPQAEAA